MNDRKFTIAKPWINHHLALTLMAMLVVGAILTWWTMRHADRSQRENLLNQARQVARAIRPDQVWALSGTQSHLTSPTYRRLKEQLASTRTIIPECRFI